MKKTDLKKQWEREQKRLQRLVKKLQSVGIEFDYDPIPRPPKTITEKSVLRLKKIDTESLLKRRKPKTEEILTGLKQRKQAVQVDEPSLKRNTKGDDEIRTPLTPERRKEIAKKAAETRRKQEQADPELKRKRDEQRRKNLEKAREKLTREQREKNLKESLEKLTPEKRKEIAKKAAETRRKQEQADPELKRKRDEQRRKNLEKAREAKLNKKLEQDKQETQETVTDTPVKDIEEKQPKPSTETPVTETTEDPETLAEYIEETDNETLDREPEIIGVDALTGEVVTEADKDQKREYNNETKNNRTSNDNPMNEGANIIDTIRNELQHAINQDVADLINESLEDMISYHEMQGDMQTWLDSMNNVKYEILVNLYTIIDDSDGERIRYNGIALLSAIYGSWSDVPNSVKEQLEFLTSEYFYPRERWAKQNAHRNRIKRYKANA